MMVCNALHGLALVHLPQSPLAHGTPATLTFLLHLEHVKNILPSKHLHLLSLYLGCFPSESSPPITSFRVAIETSSERASLTTLSQGHGHCHPSLPTLCVMAMDVCSLDPLP